MRSLADAERIRQLMAALGAQADADARVYFTGGATAVLVGLAIVDDRRRHENRPRAGPPVPRYSRDQGTTADQYRARVSGRLPSVTPGWEDRSPFIARESRISFHHFELAAQTLSKIERGHAQDLEDVQTMLARNLVTRAGLLEYFDAIEPALYRYPAIDAKTFRAAVEQIVHTEKRDRG